MAVLIFYVLLDTLRTFLFINPVCITAFDVFINGPEEIRRNGVNKRHFVMHHTVTVISTSYLCPTCFTPMYLFVCLFVYLCIYFMTQNLLMFKYLLLKNTSGSLMGVTLKQIFIWNTNATMAVNSVMSL